MGLVVGSFKAFGGQVGVNLCSDQVSMAKQFLDAAEISTRIQQVGSITVPELVGSDLWVQTRGGEMFLQAQLQVPGIKWRGLGRIRQECGSIAGGTDREQIPIMSDRFQSLLPYWD